MVSSFVGVPPVAEVSVRTGIMCSRRTFWREVNRVSRVADEESRARAPGYRTARMEGFSYGAVVNATAPPPRRTW